MRPTLSRRHLGALVTGIVASLALASCSADNTETAATAATTRSYTDARGVAVDIPSPATRVVTLSELSLDGTLALGLQPIGTTSGRGETRVPSYLADKTTGVPVVASVKEPNLEQILGLKPDLILVDNTTAARQSIDQLNKIAPTVMVATTDQPWDTYLATLADILGRKDEMRQMISTIDAKMTAARTRLSGRTGVTASVVRWTTTGPIALGGDAVAYQVLQRVGLSRPAAQQQNNSQFSGQQVSFEELPLIDADYLFFGALAGRDAAETALAQAHRLPTFDTLSVIRSGHVKAVDGVAWTSAAGPLGVNVILDDLTAALGQ